MKRIIKFGLLCTNFLAFRFILLYLRFSNTTRSFVAILSDYINTTLMLDSKELSHTKIWLITTKRYNFYNLLFNKRYKKIAGIKFVKDYSDVRREELLEFCKNKNIKYVFLQSGDFMVPMVNYLNRSLNHKGNSEFAVQCSLDKAIMREALNAENISRIQTIVVSSEHDLGKIDFFPVVLKPAIGTASEGVELVENTDQLNYSYQQALKNMRKTEFESTFIAEEYIIGRQFDVEGVINNGEVKIICIVEENYEGFFPNFDMNWYLFNALISDEMRQKIIETVSSAFQACEIQHGAFHCELRITNDGCVKIIELSNRMGGGFERTITELTGTNFCDAYIQSMLSKPLEITNKGMMQLDKYFQDRESLTLWTKKLELLNINYQVSHTPLLRNNKFKISIKTIDKEVIYKISEQFSLGILRIS